MRSWTTRVVGGRFLLLALLLYVLLRPLIGLGHQLAVWIVAASVRDLVATGLWQPVIGWLRLDPIYLGAAIQAAGGVQVAGLAIAGPLGTLLHALAPWAVLPPDRVAPYAGVSLVAMPGAPVLGRDLARLGADVLWLALGIWLVKRWSSRHLSIAVLGWLIQGQIVVNHLLDPHLGVADLDASGVPFALAVALPANGGWFTNGLQQVPAVVQRLIIGGTMTVIAYAAALLLVLAISGCGRLLRHIHKPEQKRAQEQKLGRPWSSRAITLAGVTVALTTAISPIGALAVGQSNWGEIAVPQLGGGRADRLESASDQIPNGPTTVQIQRNADGTWEYLVNGRPQIIRGVGYNPQYAGLSADARADLYERDFSAMHQRGINTIEGWFETQFDDVTLDYAARNGIGVLMPFELNQDWPYANPNVQQSILDHVSAYVEKYKDNPAVRMWAPGNEDLHRILYPHMVSQQDDPAARANADAFAEFLPKLVDRIHELDPNHPVIYRDAEDVYLARLKASFGATGVDRPWLVYGANVYNESRLQQIIDAWPSQFMDMPLVISEFAPGGTGPAQRPIGYQQDWTVIRSRPGEVLGGLAYTWATNGPEQLDRVFGLVDQNGVPTDGALSALSASYLTDFMTAQAGGAGNS